ncbi:MAG TPA: hypothetical protein VGC21_04635 [Telluria sp.]
MHKFLLAALILTGLAAGPAQAAATYNWKAQALDEQLGTPIEGVKISWTLTDKVANKTVASECITDAHGMCEVQQLAERSVWSGASVYGQGTAAKEGYEKLAKYSWTEKDLYNKLLVVKLSNSADLARRNASAAAAVAAESAEVEDLRIQLALATERSGIECADKTQCDKLFALTEIYMTKAADMKIQTATATTIATFNPVQPGAIGMSAARMPGRGNTSVVSVSTSCREPGDTLSKVCLGRQLRIVNMFKPFIDASLK